MGRIGSRVCLAVLSLMMVSASFADDVSEFDRLWGGNCKTSDSFAFKVRNESHQSLDIQLCLERANHTWACFVTHHVQPGDIAPHSWRDFVCHGTGAVKWSWRASGHTEIRFPKPSAVSYP